MPLHSTLVAASAAFDAVSSNLVRLFERALSAFPIAGPHLSTYADIPAYSLLFLASNAAVVWPIHFACRFMDRHPNGWWFRYKINGAKRPPAKLEEESGKGAVWGRLVVGPIQEAIVYTLLYRSILRVNMTGMPGLFTFAKRFAIAVLWTDSISYWYHRAVHTYPTLWKRLHKEHHEFIISSVYASYWGTREEGLIQYTPVWTAPLIAGMTNVGELLLWFMANEYINLHQHMGYSFPWDFMEYWPFAGANFHDFHHSRSSGLRSGNYSLNFLQIWDQLFGRTSHRYFDWLARRGSGESGDDVGEEARMVLKKGEVVVEAKME